MNPLKAVASNWEFLISPYGSLVVLFVAKDRPAFSIIGKTTMAVVNTPTPNP